MECGSRDGDLSTRRRFCLTNECSVEVPARGVVGEQSATRVEDGAAFRNFKRAAMKVCDAGQPTRRSLPNMLADRGDWIPAIDCPRIVPINVALRTPSRIVVSNSPPICIGSRRRLIGIVYTTRICRADTTWVCITTLTLTDSLPMAERLPAIFHAG